MSRKTSIGSFSNVDNNTEENAIRKPSIGIFSIVSTTTDIEENNCRKSSIGSFRNISFDNDTEEPNLQGAITLNINFLPLLVST